MPSDGDVKALSEAPWVTHLRAWAARRREEGIQRMKENSGDQKPTDRSCRISFNKAGLKHMRYLVEPLREIAEY